MDITFEFATRDDCLDKMIPSDLRQLLVERDIAVRMLADWCDAVRDNGTGWDDWDEHYKDASFRPGPLRELIDKARSPEPEA